MSLIRKSGISRNAQIASGRTALQTLRYPANMTLPFEEEHACRKMLAVAIQHRCWNDPSISTHIGKCLDVSSG
jgi:hypothetical protein